MNDFSDVSVILDELKKRHNLPSDYKLAKFLGISRTRLSNYRCGINTIDDDLAARIDKLLELPEGVIALEMHAKRSKCPQISNTFHEIAQKLAAGALCLMLVVGGALPKPAQATGQIGPVNNNIHYAHLKRRVRRRESWLNGVIQTSYRYFDISQLKLSLSANDHIQMM